MSVKLPRHAEELDGVYKAAILLLSLEPETAQLILAKLPVDLIEDVTRALAQVGDVPKELSAEVVEEFYGLKLATGTGREGGLNYARSLIREALEPGDADKVIRTIESQVQETPFAFLQKASSDNLLMFIQEEHPQTIALVASHLAHHKASEILAGLPPEKQIEVVRRMANMEPTAPDVIREVERGLATRLTSVLIPAVDRVGGLDAVAEVLNCCDRGTEKTILDGIEAEDPELVEEIRRLMFVFEDILKVDDKGIQAVLKEVDNEELCLSLKTASEELREKVFTNMSARASDLIREEMEYLGPVRLRDVESAQQRIVDIVRRLEDAGEIIVAGRGGEGDTIV